MPQSPHTTPWLLCLFVVGCLLSSCATPSESTVASSPSPQVASRSLALDPCPVDSFRQLRCGRSSQGDGTCPTAAADLQSFEWTRRLWVQDSATLRPDDQLTARLRQAGETEACCSSGCAPAPVRHQPNVEYDYVELRCIPAMETSSPAPGEPDCPAALQLPQDMPRHIAPYDPAGTREVVAEWASEGVPLVPELSWCCYRSAPAAAIGPL